MGTFIKKYFPLLFIVLIWFIFSSPYFVKGKVPFPSQYQVSFFPPWNAYQEYAGPVKNNAISDVVDQIFPWKHYTIEELKKGRIPLWNPYMLSGNPHLANYQSAVLSPFNLLFFLFPFIDAWSLMILFQPLVAGIGMLLFMRELKISSYGSLIGSVAFMFCGFIVAWMPWGTLSMAAAFLPWCLYAIEKGSKKVEYFAYAILSLSLVFCFFSGHFQVALYVFLYSLAFLIYRGVVEKNKKTFFMLSVFMVLGLVISLVQILPTLQLYALSVRSQLFTNNAGGIPWQYLVTFFAPDFYGNPVTRNDWVGYYGEWASFVGMAPFLLTVFAFFSSKNKSVVRFFIIAACVTVILSLNSPLQNLLSLTKIPVFSTSIPSRIIILFSLSLCVLAGFGFDQLFDSLKKRSSKNIIIPITIVSLFLVCIWCVTLFGFLQSDKAALARRNLMLPTVLFTLMTVGIASSLFLKKKVTFTALALVFLLVTTFDSLRFVTKWMPFDPKDHVFPDVPVITAMQKSIGQGRVFGEFGSFIDTYYRLPSVNGYEPLYSRRYGEFINSAATGRWAPADKSVVSLAKRGKYTDRVLDLLGVTVIYHPVSYNNQSWAFPVWENQKKYSAIYGDDKFQLFRNNTAMPRAKLFYEYVVKQNDNEIINTFYKQDFDFRNRIILEENPGIPQGFKETDGKAEIITMDPERVVVKVSSSKPGLLFLSDNYYPAWHAKVNGSESKILRADYAFRAVRIPQGKSEVEFYFEGFLF